MNEDDPLRRRMGYIFSIAALLAPLRSTSNQMELVGKIGARLSDGASRLDGASKQASIRMM